MILNRENKDASIDFLKRIIDVCVDFKLNDKVNQSPTCSGDFLSLIEPIPLQGNDSNRINNEGKLTYTPIKSFDETKWNFQIFTEVYPIVKDLDRKLKEAFPDKYSAPKNFSFERYVENKSNICQKINRQFTL
jgi:hypothetical protein